MTRIFVGNLAYSATEEDLRELFLEFGGDNPKVILDRETNKSRGFGFIDISDPKEADRAIAELNGTEFMGRTLTLNEAKPMARSGDRGKQRGQRAGT